MPGFKIGTGSGETPNVVETRRKHRWKFTAISGTLLEQKLCILLMSASRPHVTIEEAEMHHNQEKVFFAGKHTWEPITLVWYDTTGDGGGGDVTSGVWDWLNACVVIPSASVETPNTYKKDSELQSLDGMGGALETWNLYGCWPQDVNWSDLDYSNNEIQKVECVMRYDRAEKA